jgi:hypothetical protein
MNEGAVVFLQSSASFLLAWDTGVILPVSVRHLSPGLSATSRTLEVYCVHAPSTPSELAFKGRAIQTAPPLGFEVVRHSDFHRASLAAYRSVLC